MEHIEPLQVELDEKDEKEEEVNKNIDGGWGYYTVIGAFFINFICEL